jgi:hypothetical protein
MELGVVSEQIGLVLASVIVELQKDFGGVTVLAPPREPVSRRRRCAATRFTGNTENVTTE